jgi:ribonuclease D
MTIYLHEGDLPASFKPAPFVAVDCEMMGLEFFRDRLCLVQVSNGDGDAHLVRIAKGQTEAPRLKAILESDTVVKIIHYAAYDLASLWVHLGVATQKVYDTKIASRLTRTYTDRHGYKDLVRELVGVEIKKEEQSSDWGVDTLTDAQKNYAASDVLHLHKVREILHAMLVREKRVELAEACFEFLPTRAMLDVSGWRSVDIFAH